MLNSDKHCLRCFSCWQTVNITQTDQSWDSYFDEIPKTPSDGDTKKKSDQGRSSTQIPPREGIDVADAPDFVPQCVLCMPIKNSKNDIIGVIQVKLFF